MLVHILGLSLLTSIAVAAYFLLQNPHRGLTNVLTVHDLGRLEGNLDDLLEVIVIADHVEDPRDELRRAVQKNFQRGVKYQFLVSQSKAQEELDGYYRIFETLAKIETKRAGRGVGDQDLVRIQKLPYEWPEVPYVFYKVRDSRADHEGRYLAVRGNQKREGIAEYYSYVEPEYAHMIARGILSDAPSPIVVEQRQFAESNVVGIESKRDRHTS